MREAKETEQVRKTNRREMRSGVVGRRRMSIYMKWGDPLTSRFLGNHAPCTASISSIIGVEWAANSDSSFDYHGIVGLRPSSLDFSVPLFLWDILIAARGPQWR
jgi:hypothetical protein